MIEIKLFAPLSGNVVTSLIIVTVLSILAIVIGRKVDKLGVRETPKGFLFAVVLIVDTFNKFIKDNLPGDRFRLFGAYLFTILIYLVVGNTISLFGLNPPQANLGVAMAHSIITFSLIKFAEIRYQGVKKKLVSLLGPVSADFAVDASNQLDRRVLDAARRCRCVYLATSCPASSSRRWYIPPFIGSAESSPASSFMQSSMSSSGSSKRLFTSCSRSSPSRWRPTLSKYFIRITKIVHH
ncbi:MAG: F0F1 ATP synthase subunit A [Bacillus subtilis]|nr:F0F1 ATP synthase subunit A [Bacillus subtilis]